MKIPAFTLIEVVVALAVLSIVTALTYNGFSYLSRGTQSYMENSAEHLQLMGFVSRLERDLAIADEVYWQEDEVQLEFYNGTFLKYELSRGYFKRVAENVRDSVPAKNIRVKTVESATEFQAQPLLESLEVDALLFDQTVPLYFFKEYHAARYLERS